MKEPRGFRPKATVRRLSVSAQRKKQVERFIRGIEKAHKNAARSTLRFKAGAVGL